MAAVETSSRSWMEERNGWSVGQANTDHERELYERARNAASEAEREGDAQLQAAVAAAARAVNQPVMVGGMAPTRLDFWSLKFHCDRLEAAYRRKAATNSEYYDYVPLLLKIALCVPHLYLILRWLGSPTHLSLEDAKYVFMEVAFVNVFMSALHRVPFSSHARMRSFGAALQAVAIFLKGVDWRLCLPLLSLALVGHILGLGLAYVLDLYSRKQFLKSLPAWLLDDLSGSRPQAHLSLLYRASLSRQMWSIFYPELLNTSVSSSKDMSYAIENAPRRALGGFAGGFGGVSSLKCTQPISSPISPLSSSSSLSGGSGSSGSSGFGGDRGDSVVSCGEIMSTAQSRSGNWTRASVRWGLTTATTSSATCSQAGLDPVHTPYMRSPQLSGGVTAGYY